MGRWTLRHPAWLLMPNDLVLESTTALRMIFASGDWIRLHTEEGPYESQIFAWSASKENAIY